MLEGLRFIRRDGLVLSLMVIVAITNMLDTPTGTVLLPVYANRQLESATALGVMMGAHGAGATLGTIVFGAIGHLLPRRATFIGAFIFVGLRYWILALLPSLAVTTGVLMISGMAAGPINPILLTIFQERTPAALRGRVFSILMAMAMIASPLGILLSGYIVEAIGLGTILRTPRRLA
ncbi:MAG: MFS transporter [Deinococcus sp.]|nr:MFS transporter [Deinococcus sp.]